MDKAAITERIKSNISEISTFLQSLNEEQLNAKSSDDPQDKWTIAENAVHLVKSVSPINIALSLPRITFLIFGKSSTSRTYDEIVTLYTSSLSGGAKASKAYVPKSGKTAVKSRIIDNVQDNYQTLVVKLNAWSEEDMDQYRLPHPIIGKLTLREMLYFTIYHLEHHLSFMKKLLQ